MLSRQLAHSQLNKNALRRFLKKILWEQFRWQTLQYNWRRGQQNFGRRKTYFHTTVTPNVAWPKSYTSYSLSYWITYKQTYFNLTLYLLLSKCIVHAAIEGLEAIIMQL